MTHREKLQKVFAEFGIEMSNSWLSVSVISGYNRVILYNRDDNAIRGLNLLCERILSSRSLKEVNKHLRRRQMGMIYRHDSSWRGCAGWPIYGNIPGKSNLMTNLKRAAKRVQKILAA